MPYPLYGLRAWRTYRGLDVQTLSMRASVSVPTLRRIEQGAIPSIRTVQRVAVALDLEPVSYGHELLHRQPTFSITELADCAVCEADIDERSRRAG